jgi:tetratricopeptide (TPR) repeat protein
MPILPSILTPQSLQPIGRPDVLLEQARRADRDGRTEEAVSLLSRILAIDPIHAESIKELGLLQLKRGMLAEATRQFDRYSRIDPSDATIWWQCGITQLKLGDFKEALRCFDALLQLTPRNSEVHLQRADALNYLGRFEEAAAAYGLTATMDDRALIGLGHTCAWTGRYDEAIAAFDRAIERLQPNDWAVYTKANFLLRHGDLIAGLPLYERRWSMVRGEDRAGSDRPLWLGDTSLQDRVLYLYCEQGLGDTLQFCRYAALAAKGGAQVIMRVSRPLVRVMMTLQGVSELIAEDDPVPDHDLQCPLMSLPLAFRTTLGTIPADIPYLNADRTAASVWQHRLTGVSKKKIGLVWAGGSPIGLLLPGAIAVDNRRSITLADLTPLVGVPNCAFFSLQLGLAAEQAARAPDGMGLHDYTSELADFADTAALVENLDLIISVDTSTAHLAGALGKPVWLLNRFDTDWRWFLDREDSPWYPTMRIFRQPAPGEWDAVIRSVTAALREFAAA